ncbi:MAG: GNAT family N-acetyltransferase [Rhodospirillales bacterium]|nr:GNAT family N-acetyltransferase [Rhodospirillales bacterium]
MRRIGPEDAAAFRALRLAALAAHPEAFGSSLEEEGVKQRHKGTVWGVYVDPAQRGAGIAQALITAVIDSAQAAGLGVLQLAVTVGNVPAIRLYEAAGFVRTGIEPRALRVGDRFLDEALMVRLLD